MACKVRRGTLVAYVGVGNVSLVSLAYAGALAEQPLPGGKVVAPEHEPLPLREALHYLCIESMPATNDDPCSLCENI